jgi:hypothetical protein
MRERLADWRCFVHLAHKTTCSESRDQAEITASSESRAVASDFVRQISSPFTTRLALVFASWADENIIPIETVQDAFVAFFLLVDFEKTSQQLLKVPKAPKAPRSAFRYV